MPAVNVSVAFAYVNPASAPILPPSLNCTCVSEPAADAADTVALTHALPFHCNNCPLDVPEIVVSVNAANVETTPVKLLPSPAYAVAVKIPLLGLYVNPVSVSRPCVPVAPSTKTG